MKKIGMRTIKTGIAVTLGVLLGELGIVQNTILTVSACIMSMKSTIRRSLESGLSRILGTLLGGFLGYIFSILFNGNPWVTGLGVVLIIHLCYLFKFSYGAVVSSLTFVSIIMGVNGNNPLTYSVGRTIDTMFGVIIAISINYWISRKKYINYLYSEFLLTEAKFLELARDIRKDKMFYRYEELQHELENLNDFYNQLIDEIYYFNKCADISTLKVSLELCTQIFYHFYGMYTLSLKSMSEYEVDRFKYVRLYHENCIKRLLYEVKSESDSRDDEVF